MRYDRCRRRIRVSHISRTAPVGSLYNYYVSRLPATARRPLWKYHDARIFYSTQLTYPIVHRNEVSRGTPPIRRIGMVIDHNRLKHRLKHIPENITSAVSRQESAQDGKLEEMTFPEQLLISISLHRGTS